MKIKKIPPAETHRATPLLIKSLLDYSLMVKPEREIVYRDLVRYNYHTFNERVRRLANVLQNLGLEGGETVAVMDYDSHRYLEAYFAVPMTGNVLHTINWRLSPAQILFTINHAEDVILIVNTDFKPIIEKFDMPTVRHILYASDTDDSDYEAKLKNAPTTYTFPDFEEDAVATTFYTTGTTGEPKGVYFTHRQLVLHTLSLAASFGFMERGACAVGSDDVYMPLTPMFHVHAWGFPFLATMFSMKQVYVGKLSPPVLMALMEKEKPTFSHCVPTVLQLVLTCPEGANLDLKNWKLVIGGAPLPKPLAAAAMDRGIDLITGYGMSETCPVITTSHIYPEDVKRERDWQLEERTRAGTPSPFTNLKIDERGEIIVRAPWLTGGYVKDPEKGAQLWESGYLHTGDVGSMNTRHSLKISDRIKDVIKSGGEWISSTDLENMILAHPAIAEAAVVGMPDPKWGERPYALLVLKPGQTLELQEIKNHIQGYIDGGQINKWAMPERVEFATSIPKTSVGKIDKKKIRSDLSNG